MAGRQVRLSQTAAVIVALPSWASYTHPATWLSQIPQFNNSIIISLHIHITGSDITIVINHHLVNIVPYRATKEPK
jgi:hypothetical protein